MPTSNPGSAPRKSMRRLNRKQAKPVLENLLGHLLSRASRFFDHEFTNCLRERGLTLAAWRVLVTLSRSDRLSVSDLAKAALVQQPTLTNIVTRLEGMSLVQRCGDLSDKRISYVVLTARGLDIVEDLMQAAARLENKALSGYERADAQVLKRALKHLIAHLNA